MRIEAGLRGLVAFETRVDFVLQDRQHLDRQGGDLLRASVRQVVRRGGVFGKGMNGSP